MRIPYSWLREVVAAGAPDWDVAPGDMRRFLWYGELRIARVQRPVARIDSGGGGGLY